MAFSNRLSVITATSQARASGFNKPVVDAFFNLLISVMAKFGFKQEQIWNTDESGCPTVMPPPKVIAKKGMKQVQQTVSHERGQNVTILAFICAIGTHCPPVYIFPRAKFRPEMSCNGPPGCLGMAHPSGWINNEMFLASLQNFVKFTKASITNRQLLLLDNHSSHLDFHVVQYCKANGITMLTFPPHCSHRIQPLDVSVFGPFKNAMKNSFNTWHQLNPGKRISIHDVAELSRVPYLQTFTPQNIIAGFKKSGIYPFNRDIFPPESFLASYATDRPMRELM